MSKIESGDRRVDVDDLVALAEALEVTPDQLLSADVAESRSRSFLPHDEELAPVMAAARKARESTGLGYRAIGDYLRMFGPITDSIIEASATEPSSVGTEEGPIEYAERMASENDDPYLAELKKSANEGDDRTAELGNRVSDGER